MVLTYSINNGTLIETNTLSSLNDMLSEVPDNTLKKITPKNIRDNFLTVYSNIAFKPTINSAGIEYIGIDTYNPSNRDLKEKILLGKRTYGGVDILNDTLLQSDSDIFLYNTKKDTDDNNATKITILAGTNSSLYPQAPYIEAVHNADDTIDLNIKNNSTNGSINIEATNGVVNINGVDFPKTTTYPSDGQILKYSGNYPNGNLVWSDNNVQVSQIGSLTADTKMTGSVSVNGYSLEFIDDNIVPETIGGVMIGSSFSANSFTNASGGKQNWPVCEVIREILYPYVKPSCSLKNEITYKDFSTISTSHFSISTDKASYIKYDITKYSNDIKYKVMCDGNNVIEWKQYSGKIGEKNTFYTDITSFLSDGYRGYTVSVFIDDSVATYSYDTIVYKDMSLYYNSSDLETVLDDVSYQTFINSANDYRYESVNCYDNISVEYNCVDEYLYMLLPSYLNTLLQIFDNNNTKVYDSRDTENTQVFEYLGYINNYNVYRSTDKMTVTYSVYRFVLEASVNSVSDIVVSPSMIYEGLINQITEMSFKINKVTDKTTTMVIVYDGKIIDNELLNEYDTSEVKTIDIDVSMDYMSSISSKDINIFLYDKNTMYAFTKTLPIKIPVFIYPYYEIAATDYTTMITIINNISNTDKYSMNISNGTIVSFDNMLYHYIIMLDIVSNVTFINMSNGAVITATSKTSYPLLYKAYGYTSNIVAYRFDNVTNTQIKIKYQA